MEAGHEGSGLQRAARRGVTDVAMRGSSGPPTCSSGSRRRTSAARTCTCTRGGPTSSRAVRSGTRTSGRWSRSARTSSAAGRRLGLPALQHRLRQCVNCNRGLTNYCLRRSRGEQPGAAYGFADMGPYQGGQAEYLRVPWGDFNACASPRTPRRSRPTTSWSPTSSRPAGTRPRWPASSRARPW